MSVQRFREWCLTLKINDEDGDMIAMAQSVKIEIDTHAYLNLKASVREELEVNEEVITSVRSEALRCQRWLYWRHICGFTRTMVIMARVGITLWKNEVDWCTQWLRLKSPMYISRECFLERVREILRL